MKILVTGINYAPDLIGIAKYTTEMCQYLSKMGHEVRVVTAPPYYPHWRISRPYRGFAYATEDAEGVRIIRCPLYVPKSQGALSRILHHLSFALASAPVVIIEALKFRPDVVFTVAPSLLGTPAALAAGRLVGAKTWLHVQDFEVDAAFDLNFLPGGRLRRAALWIERKLLRGADRVSAISAKMAAVLETKGVPRPRIVEFRNWVDTSAMDAMSDREAVAATRAALLPVEASTVALYAGNIGAKQGLDTVAAAARKLAATRPDIFLVFCGSGPAKQRLMQTSADLPNVRFLELQPADVFLRLLLATEIHLLPQCQEIQDLVLPSKLGGMLASGRPVIAMAEDGTQLASELKDVSLLVPPGDADALAGALVRLADDSALRDSLGFRGVELARKRWDRKVILSQLERALAEIAAKRRRQIIVRKAGVTADPIKQIGYLDDDLQFSKKKQAH